MTQIIGKNRNVNNVATISTGIALSSSTTVKIADANDKRTFFHVDNGGSTQGIFLKLQKAIEDDDKKGIFITGKSGNKPYWQMPPGDIYTGEISAIADTGTPNAFVTEY